MSAVTARILRAAVERIETVGWCQGVGVDQSDRGCAVYSINAVYASLSPADLGGFFYDEPVRRVEQYLGLRPCALWEWNDEKGRTQEDVVKALLATADLEDVR